MTPRQQKLVLENSKLVYSITNQYRNRKNYADLVQEGFLGLCMAANNFDEIRGNCFTTYAYRYILGRCLNFINQDKLVKPHRVGSTFEDVITVVAIDTDIAKLLYSIEDTSTQADENLLFATIEDNLTELEYNIVLSLYSGYSKKDVSKIFQLTTLQLNDKIKEIRTKLSFLQKNQ